MSTLQFLQTHDIILCQLYKNLIGSHLFRGKGYEMIFEGGDLHGGTENVDEVYGSPCGES